LNVKVASDDEFIRAVAARERKDWKSSRKTEFGLESGDNEGGR